MKRAQAGLEALILVGALLVGGMLVVDEISSSTAAFSKEKSERSLEALADAVEEVQVQGSSARKEVSVVIPPEVDPEHSGKTEANTLVVALNDGSEIVVPVEGCLIGSLPTEPGEHTVVVKGGACASLANNEFHVSPSTVVQQLQAGGEASLPITVQTSQSEKVQLSSSQEIRDFIDLNTTQPAVQYEVELTAPTVHSAKIIIPVDAQTGVYEGHISAETSSHQDRISVRIEVYNTQLEVVTFSDSSRDEESNKFDVEDGLYYRVYIRKNGQLKEGNLKAELYNPSNVPVKPYPPSVEYTSTGIYEGYFKVKDNLYNEVPGTELGEYTLRITDADSGQVIEETVEGTETAWIDLSPEEIDEWMRPDTQLSTPITLETSSPTTVDLALTGDLDGLVDLMSSTQEYDSTRSISMGEDPLTLNDVYIKVPEDQGEGTWTGTITATTEFVQESIPVSITTYSSDLGWKIQFKDLGTTANEYSGEGATSQDESLISLSSTGWKMKKATDCEGRWWRSGYCRPSDAWGECDNEPTSDWNTLSYDDSSWTSVDFPAYSTDYNTVGNFLCEDCTGFFRKTFSLTQEQIDSITSITAKFRADEGLQCFVNGEDLGFETSCQTDWLPELESETTSSQDVLNALQVGENVIACRLQERQRHSETYFKYFDLGLEVHKEIPPEDPLAEVEFEVLDQDGDQITGLDFSNSIELKKLDETPHPTLPSYISVQEDSGVYSIQFSPSELASLPQGGSGTYGLLLEKDYQGLEFTHTLTFNIDETPDEFPWRISIQNPSSVIVTPGDDLTLKAAVLNQEGNKITDHRIEVQVFTTDGTQVKICNNAPLVGEYYSCTIEDVEPGQYWVEFEDKDLNPKDLVRSFTFNAVST